MHNSKTHKHINETYIYHKIHTEVNKETNKQTNKQTDKQTDRQTDRQTNRQADKQTNKQTDKQTKTKTKTKTINSYVNKYKLIEIQKYKKYRNSYTNAKTNFGEIPNSARHFVNPFRGPCRTILNPLQPPRTLQRNRSDLGNRRPYQATPPCEPTELPSTAPWNSETRSPNQSGAKLGRGQRPHSLLASNTLSETSTLFSTIMEVHKGVPQKENSLPKPSCQLP